MVITYFASASNPADNGSLTSPFPNFEVAVTPPASMVAGDLAVVIAQVRWNTDITVFTTGGQTWTSEAAFKNNTGGNQISARLFWCRYNGTWNSNPSFSMGIDATCSTVVMHVFRPTTGANTWAVDVVEATGSFVSGSTPFTKTITGITTNTNGAMVFAAWATDDDNTWDTLTSGWSTPGSAQYRNTAGSDQSNTAAYQVFASAQASGNVAKNQATLGGDPGATSILAFKEVKLPNPILIPAITRPGRFKPGNAR